MKFSDIITFNDLLTYLNIKQNKFNFLFYHLKIDLKYDEVKLPKKNGDDRIISIPNNHLLRLQKKIASGLQESLFNKKDIYAHGFIKGRSIFSNAKEHVHKKVILSFDLEDFFGSFNFGRVLGFFEKNKHLKLEHKVAVILARLVCYKNTLPQGAPTSPIITNLICNKLDFNIFKLAKRFRLTFTRYADDMTFSTNWSEFKENKYDDFCDKLNTLISLAGFKLNNKKTRIAYQDCRQEVTGLVTNAKVNVIRNFYKNTRAMVNKFYFMENDENKTKFAKTIQGRLAFIIDIYRKNERYKRNRENNNNIESGRIKLLKQFQYYNRFLNNNKPVIFTEGKTDKFYIISALKKYYSEFPKLIQVNKNNEFELKIDVRSMSNYIPDKGGSGELNKIIYMLYGKDNSRFYKYYSNEKKNFVISNQPIIFLYDRENINKDCALSKLINLLKSNIKEEEINQLFDDSFGNYVKIKSQKNAYVITLPFVEGLDDNQIKCVDKNGTIKYNYEIEDLFSKEFLSSSFNGKKFNRNGDISEDEINKNGFSLYIYNNWQNIPDKEFDNFRKLLENISKLVN